MTGSIRHAAGLGLMLSCFAGAAGACSSTAGAGDGGAGGMTGQGGRAGADAGAAGGAAIDGGSACSGATQSCAGGERCCAGLTCCAGVPVPTGQEYCGTVCPVSDRNIKRDITSIDRDAVLEALSRLPISTWSYRAEQPPARHIGPMAQDFMSTFHVGSSDKTILQVDADGVALAAIQSLNEKVKRLEIQNAALSRQLDALRADRARGTLSVH
jgi:hypothetical protein